MEKGDEGWGPPLMPKKTGVTSRLRPPKEGDFFLKKEEGPKGVLNQLRGGVSYDTGGVFGRGGLSTDGKGKGYRLDLRPLCAEEGTSSEGRWALQEKSRGEIG